MKTASRVPKARSDPEPQNSHIDLREASYGETRSRLPEVALGGHALASEFKINYLKPAVGPSLVARAKAMGAGK